MLRKKIVLLVILNIGMEPNTENIDKDRKERKRMKEDEDIEEKYCSDATYLARQMTLTERLSQSDSMVIILKEFQCNKIFVNEI